MPLHAFSPAARTAERKMAADPRRARRKESRREESTGGEGRSHGILVYAQGEPVGWCQYGLQQELPRIDNCRSYPGQPPEKPGRRLWRITCFVVHKKHRRRGIASIALKAVLEGIRKKGGGVVEAFPLAEPKTSTFGNMSTHGTVSMFRKEKRSSDIVWYDQSGDAKNFVVNSPAGGKACRWSLDVR